MATILEPSPTSNRAVAVRPGQPLRLRADTAWNWFARTNEGAWSQFATGALEAFYTTASAVTNRLTFDRLEVAIGSGATPDTSTTRHFDLCEGPPAVLWATARMDNEALSEPAMRPWEGEDDDPPLGTPLVMPGAARGGLGTTLLETVSEGAAGPANLVASWGPGVFVDTAGGLGVRTPFTNDARGLGPFPAVAAWYQGGAYFEHDFGKSRNLALTRVLYEEPAAPGHVAVVRGDGRRNTYRLSGGVYTGAAALRNTLTKSGGVFEETTPSGRVYRYTSAGRLERVVDRAGNPVYYAYDVNDRLQRIDGLPGQGTIGLVPYFSYDGAGLLQTLRLEDAAAPANTRESSFTYDADGNLLRIVGPESCVTYFEYQPATRLQAVTDPEGFRWYFAYDGDGRVERVLDALGQPTYFSWTPAAALGARRDRAATVTYFRWGPFGAPERVYNPGTGADYFHYDGDGNLVRSTTRLGRDWQYEYDARANRIAIQDPLLARTYLAYDGQDLLRTYVDPLGRPTYLTFDAQRNRARWIDALGHTAYYEYEATGLLRQRKDRRGSLTYFGWDARGNLSRVTDPLQHTTYFGYNQANERTAQVDPLGRLSYLEYDPRGRLTRRVDPVGAPSYWAYDARCNLVLERDARMHATTHLYDGNSNRTRTVDALGGATYFEYDPEERLSLRRDARMQATSWTYDVLGRRQRQVDPYGAVAYTAYDAAHQVERQVDERGSATYFAYDPAGRLNEQKDAEQRTSYLGYDLAGQRVLTTDRRTPASPAYFEYDPRGWQRQTKDALGAVTYAVFDAEGNRLRSIDPRGLTTYFAYDAAGRPTHTTDQEGGVTYTGYDRAGQTVLRLDPLGAATYMAYDPAGRSQVTLDPAGLRTYLAYDLSGNLTLQALEQGWGRQPWGASPYGGERAVSYFAYDALDRRQRSIDPYGAVAYMAYDRVGNVYFQVDERGFATYHLYDRLNRRTHTRQPVDFAVTYVGYDAVGNVVARVDQQGATTYLAYDRLDRVSFTVDPAQALTYARYDAVGNRTEQHVQLGAGGELRSTYFQYDLVGRMARQIAADGGSTYFGYDLAGNQTLVVDPEGRPTYLAYDRLNRQSFTTNAFAEKTYLHFDARSSVTRRIDPEGRTAYFGFDPAGRTRSQSNALGEYSYFFHDAKGNRTHVLNPRGYSTYFRFDLLGRPTHKIDALGGMSYMAYDAVGNRTLAQDELGNATYFFFDGLNRQTRVMDATLKSTYMAYDSRSSMTSRIDADGRGTYLAYDLAGRLERQFHRTPVVGEAETPPSYYLYDQVGNLKLVDDRLAGLGVSYFDHDELDRVVKKTTVGGAVYYAYDLSGQKVHLRDPDLSESYYVYDAVGRLEKLQVAAGRTAYFAYDTSGMVVRRHAPLNEVVAYYTYDVAGSLERLENRSVLGSLLSYFAYERNAVGAQTRIRHEGGEDTYYEYDALERLTRELRLPTGTARAHDDSYAYDAVGNRTLKVDHTAGQNVYYTFDARNLLTKEWNKDAPETTYFEYDNSRRMTSSKIVGGQSSYFTHDQRGQVEKIEFARATSPDPTQEFGYTGTGERAKLTIGDGSATDLRLAYDGQKLLTEKNAASGDSTVRRYRHNLSPLDCMGSCIEWDFGGTRRYGAFNGQGTLVGLLQDFGGGELVENTYLRDVFGRLVTSSTPLSSDGGKLQFLTSGLLDLQLANVQMNPLLLGGGCFLPRWGVPLAGGGSRGRDDATRRLSDREKAALLFFLFWLRRNGGVMLCGGKPHDGDTTTPSRYPPVTNTEEEPPIALAPDGSCPELREITLIAHHDRPGESWLREWSEYQARTTWRIREYYTSGTDAGDGSRRLGEHMGGLKLPPECKCVRTLILNLHHSPNVEGFFRRGTWLVGAGDRETDFLVGPEWGVPPQRMWGKFTYVDLGNAIRDKLCDEGVRVILHRGCNFGLARLSMRQLANAANAEVYGGTDTCYSDPDPRKSGFPGGRILLFRPGELEPEDVGEGRSFPGPR